MENWARVSGDLCVYCGRPAESDEHFPPRDMGVVGVILPACLECNSMAGTQYPAEFWARAAFVQLCIARKYKKVLQLPVWSMEELNELGPRLRQEVERCQENRRIVHARLAWSAATYLHSIDTHNAFAQMGARTSGITESGKLPMNSIEKVEQLRAMQKALRVERQRLAPEVKLAEIKAQNRLFREIMGGS